MSTTTTRRQTAPTAAATAVTAVLALGALVQVALRTETGQGWDNSAMTTVVAGRDAQLALLSVLGYVSIGAVVAAVVGCVAVALLRGDVRLAVGAVTVIAGANLTTQLLKRVLLERSDFGFGVVNSLPSGHTTVVASAVGAALLVAPAALRAILAVAGGFAVTLTGTSTIVAGWHRPADVLAALAVSLAWTAGVATFMRGSQSKVSSVIVGSLVGCVSGLIFLVVIGVRPAYGWVGFTQAALVLGAVTLVTAVYVAAAAAVAPSD